MTTTTNKEERLNDEEAFLDKYVTWALWALAIIICVATVTGLVESYNGLYIWFATHHIVGFWADWAPLAVDSFTVVGELAIFAGISRHWGWTSRVLPWCSALLGICASVAANVGDKIQFHNIPTDLTAAAFPLAGAFGIVIGLGVLKRVAKDFVARKEAKTPVVNANLDAGFNYVKNTYGHDSHANQWATQVPIQPYEVPSPQYPSAEELKSRAHFGPVVELKGLDALIPQQPAETAPTPSLADFVQPPTPETTAGTAGQSPVSREEARMQLSDLKAGRQIIQPDGLDPTVTGAQPFTPADVLNYKP